MAAPGSAKILNLYAISISTNSWIVRSTLTNKKVKKGLCYIHMAQFNWFEKEEEYCNFILVTEMYIVFVMKHNHMGDFTQGGE